MRILVIGGMHGNEPLGIEVVKLFQQKSANNIDVQLANISAIKANSRFTEQDLNRSFPGDSKSQAFEPQRAAELLILAKQYDLVLDFHNTYCENNDCVFVGESASDLLYKAAAVFGLGRVIVADYDCMNKYAPNCISIEVSMSSKLNDPKLWYDRIVQLSNFDAIEADTSILEKYRFVYRMTIEDRDRLGLPNYSMKAFEPINNELAEKLGVKSPAYPIFVADKFTPYNYGGLLNKI